MELDEFNNQDESICPPFGRGFFSEGDVSRFLDMSDVKENYEQNDKGQFYSKNLLVVRFAGRGTGSTRTETTLGALENKDTISLSHGNIVTNKSQESTHGDFIKTFRHLGECAQIRL